MKVWSKFRVYLRRRYGKVKYFWVLERHKSGIYHMHMLFNRYMPQDWISDKFSSLGGGEVVWIKYVDEQRIVEYVTKYLTKFMGRQLEFEVRIKRYGHSNDVKITAYYRDPTGEWMVVVWDPELGIWRRARRIDFVLLDPKSPFRNARFLILKCNHPNE